MEKNETLYKKVEDGWAYNFFRYVTTAMIGLGIAGIIVGYITRNRETVDAGYAATLAGAMWKGGVLMSKNQFEPVSGLEKKVRE